MTIMSLEIMFHIVVTIVLGSQWAKAYGFIISLSGYIIHNIFRFMMNWCR